MKKSYIYGLGIVTLLVFPIPALLALYFFLDLDPLSLLDFKAVFTPISLFGITWGLVAAAIVLRLGEHPKLNEEFQEQNHAIRAMNLNVFDKLFLSFCAGFGEEILFRLGIQHYLGVLITSILFIAIHGYFKFKKSALFVFALFLLLFILSLGYLLPYFGIWFCIWAHFTYDFVLFLKAK